jgi:formylglycine-generating enzyme required for sulfatase activity/tetratricopeptide (TPR) repeat protein
VTEESSSPATRHLPPTTCYYQLTHDYLVPALRHWLTRKQKETRRGRAELLLVDRANVWKARPENRQLPSLWQWLQIRWLTHPKHWTPPQRKMMGKASRYHAVRGLVVAVVLALFGWASSEGYHWMEAEKLVEAIVSADTIEVPRLVERLTPYRRWADSRLQWYMQHAREGSHEHLHASLALVPVDHGQVEYLYGRLLGADPKELTVIRDSLPGQPNALIERLWDVLRDIRDDSERRFRAACALASFDTVGEDPHQRRWRQASKFVADQLLVTVQRNPSHYAPLLETLRPVRNILLGPLAEIYRQRERPDSERSFATAILADYAAGQPQMLADLLMAADDKQFAVLYPKFKEQGQDGLPVLTREIDRQLQPRWIDPPLGSSWKQPDRDLVRKIEVAHGLVAERFAFCQTMPIQEFPSIAEGLTHCGYRPNRFRPYAKGGEGPESASRVLVAAVWTRDGQQGQVAHGLSAAALAQRDSELRKQSFHPVDAIGYLSDGMPLYAAVWLKAPAKTIETELAVGLDPRGLEAKETDLRKAGYWRLTTSVMLPKSSQPAYTVVWSKLAGGNSPQAQAADNFFQGIEAEYSGQDYPADLQIDVQLSRATPPPSGREWYTQQLVNAEKVLKMKPDDAEARLQRGCAYHWFQENEKALEDLSWVIRKLPEQAGPYGARTTLYARLGKAKEAKADLAKFQELSTDRAGYPYREAVVLAYLGEDAEGMKRLESAIAADPNDPRLLSDAASAYGLATEVMLKKDADKANAYAERAVVLLKAAIRNGYAKYVEIQTERDLDPLRGRPDFQAILDAAHVDRHYAAVWHPVTGLTSTEVHGLDPRRHLARAQELIAQGYRPVSVSVAEIQPGQPWVTASVWHRPVVPDEEKEKLANRQANAAVALLRMNQPEKVWLLLRHRPDPRVRSYLIHRLSLLEAEPRAILHRLEEEPDVSTRRALLLCLGEFGEPALPSRERDRLIPRLLELYRNDPDPGIHGSVAWLLRQWGQKDKLIQLDQELARDGRPPASERRWYVNSQGQTFVIVPGPVEFLMGSPRTEAWREHGETLHRRRIGRTFAVAAHAVTVEQFLRFRNENFNRRWAPSSDCPSNSLSWYSAAEYCNWLSKQAGIATDQWCYEPNPEGRYLEGMRIKPNSLQLTGYRLPTEAEWEYACRAGAVTSRFCGETEELLERYACCSNKNFWNRKLIPVGSLKPNDLGLFDMLGNVVQWCQFYDLAVPAGRPVEDRHQAGVVSHHMALSVRGGGFGWLPDQLRAASRNTIMAWDSGVDVGFRPARTIR